MNKVEQVRFNFQFHLHLVNVLLVGLNDKLIVIFNTKYIVCNTIYLYIVTMF